MLSMLQQFGHKMSASSRTGFPAWSADDSPEPGQLHFFDTAENKERRDAIKGYKWRATPPVAFIEEMFGQAYQRTALII